MKPMNPIWIDRASSATMVITLILFLIALFEKGITHEILLEAGVFLVSVKLILSTQKTEYLLQKLREDLSQWNLNDKTPDPRRGAEE